MFHQNLGKKFQDGGQTSAQRPLGVLAVSRGAEKSQFSGAWYKIQLTGGHFQLVRLTSFAVVCHEAILVVVAAHNWSMIGGENTELDVPEESPR